MVVVVVYCQRASEVPASWELVAVWRVGYCLDLRRKKKSWKNIGQKEDGTDIPAVGPPAGEDEVGTIGLRVGNSNCIQLSSVVPRSSTSSLSSSSATLDTLFGSKLDEIEGESSARLGGTKLPEVGDIRDGWLTEPGIDIEASFLVFFDQSDLACSRGGFRYPMSGGNAGAAINDDVGTDKGAEVIADTGIEEEGGTRTASPVLSKFHEFGGFILILVFDFDLEGIRFRNGCCLREMLLDLVSESSARGEVVPALFLGAGSESEALLGANSELAVTGLGAGNERLGEVAGVMTQLAVVVFVAEDMPEE